jgi:DNA-binding transcriptional LysR family regulator
MDRFDAITAFVAVAEHAGFAPAARALKLSPSTITRLIAALEGRLGVRLFQRTTRVVHLTDAGRRFLDRARRIIADLDEAERLAESERAAPTGRLTITAPVQFGRLHVTPLVAAFLRRHPDVQIDLRLTDRIVNLVEDGIDVAVRIGTLDDSSDIARRVGSVRRVLAASPAYLRTHGTPRQPNELVRHELIDFTGQGGAGNWRFWRDGRPIDIRVAPRLIVNDAAAAVWSSAHGLGLVMVLSYQVADALDAKSLRLVLTSFAPPPVPIQLVYPSSRLLSANVRALIELQRETCDWAFSG